MSVLKIRARKFPLKMAKLFKNIEPLAGVVLGGVATGGFGGADLDGTLIGLAIP